MLKKRGTTGAQRIGYGMQCLLLMALVPICGASARPLEAATTPGCDYYASPIGTGNGLTASTPFRLNKFWTVAAPGKTLCLLDGTYTGVDSMIDPPDSLSGTTNSPITVRAFNDGKVSLNGRGITYPVRLSNNNFFILEGFNAYDSKGHVIALYQSNANIIRRIVAWNANKNGNSKVFQISSSKNNLLEDIAGFGTARKIFEPYQSTHTTIRRAWGRWEGSFRTGPKMTFTLIYNSYNTIIENSIGTWDGKEMNGSSPDQAYGIFAADRLDGSQDARSKILGSIAYLPGRSTFHARTLFWIGNQNSLEYTDNVAYIEPGTNAEKTTFWSRPGTNLVNRVGKNLTSVGGAGIDLTDDIQTSNIEHGGAVNQVSSIFLDTKGASVCKRYLNGTLTDQPLWPWPMNQRIIDAMKEAGKTVVDVTRTIEQLFGAIPSECKGTYPAPRNLRVLAQ